MKKIILIIGLVVATVALKAQNQQAYQQAMGKGLGQLATAQTLEELQAVAAHFERIAAAMPDQWHPHYYAALANINASFRVEGVAEKDKYTQKAQAFIDAADKASPDNSEVVALQGYKYMIELSADPANRGQSLSQKAMRYFGKALQIDPKNPRANIFLAQMEMGMAQFFGSSTEKACGQASQALKLFESSGSAQSFDPAWGKEVAEEIVSQCGK
ncbi:MULTISPECIES: hypothetical protein [Roseivirga]|jgi:tetratricopeptide (TPR) repeat protein|uniref:hypothetical protein n=1 Tax=Roseivirga TaxID=290180 RepID=UPI00257F141A|nr:MULTISPECIES: hypothetical protein [Roseivirga]MEC7755214.1 hypothetical protein [Bacteroidota bacterium]|tara:strand:+ start:15563 stop:16207 length:645 start_codon:yes stop_codon:yes gene_type:complete